MATHRILSFDGGGIRGLLTLVVLERLQAEVPNIISAADLLAGTSTGGIIALGLAHGVSVTELRDLYYEKGSVIFRDSFLDDILDIGRIAGAEYTNRGLRRELRRILGPDTRLKDLRKHVLIPTFDLDNEDPDPDSRTWKPKFFHNFEGEDSDGDANCVDVGLYTSAAPTYFPSVDGYVDGGVVTNNPSMAALAQTQDPRTAGTSPPGIGDLALLSMGTGRTPYYIAGKRHNWGFAQWAKPLVRIAIEGVGEVAAYQCRQILRDRFCRVNPTIPADNPVGLDEWHKRDDLVRLGEQYDIAPAVNWLNQFWS